MKISKHIDRRVLSASVLEDTRVMANWLREVPYMAIVDEDSNVIGIITIKDIQSNPEALNVLDCDISKPIVSPEQIILDAFEKMKEAHTDYLPVYHGADFLGVITLQQITERLAQILELSSKDYQRAIHDLRGPVNNVQALIGLLRNHDKILETNELLDLLMRASQNAIDILEDLLFMEVSKNSHLEKKETEMNSFFMHCIKEQSQIALQKNIDFKIDLCKETIVKFIHPSRVKRAIQNVISNAIKFSYRNASIKISSKIDGDKVILKIVDCGIGIPHELQADVFKKFSPAQRSGTEGEPTTGLGLSLSKDCIEEHDGQIYFKSTEGSGSKFYIVL